MPEQQGKTQQAGGLKARNASPAPKVKAAAKNQKVQEKAASDAKAAPVQPSKSSTSILMYLAYFLYAVTVFGGLGAFTRYVFSNAAVIEAFLTQHADMIIALVPLITFAPLILVLLVTCCRAIGDLRELPAWLGLPICGLVVAALATLVMLPGPVRTYLVTTWARIEPPLEAFLVKHASEIVMGGTVILIAPLAILTLVLVGKVAWGLRVELKCKSAPGAAAKDKK
eukprot:gnl/TRDRNA2_/TRDRNA2_188276_c0_seq1.p1 gnl/TRDRNA2_/TRDRNA2_188276_c0~~gnl/TRDRNA2_/TRDRNA2_188276_c0_seq1.p1  ORF type:complete len:226 (-),score=38.97 gnl/TRDRNA2_/TRDRNA2_188276_c0_seq1:113-790(-)